MKAESPMLSVLAAFYRKADEEIGLLAAMHAGQLRCHCGCAGCCVDNISIFWVEAENIRAHYPALLASGNPHTEGVCAFLDKDSSCRIYAERPYVCRMQGLPFRWIEIDAAGEAVEWRDICPDNAPPQGIQMLSVDQCLTPSPVWERLAGFQKAVSGSLDRIKLRSLFKGAEESCGA